MIVSGLVSFGMMKFQMKMINKWMNKFFDEETEWIKKELKKAYK